MRYRDGLLDNQLLKVHSNAAQNIWSVETDINWALPIKRPGWMKRKFHTALVSQFKYGELATIQICEKLKPRFQEPHLIELLNIQITDETRHVAAYNSYLQRLGDQAPQDPALAHMLSCLLDWKGSYLGLIVAVHVLLEGEALRTLQDIANDFSCPLFADMNARITRDEARHVAFGTLYLRARLQDLSAEERVDIFRFIHSLWKETTSGIFSGFYIPGFVSRRLRRQWVEQGWQRHCKTMADVELVPFEQAIRL